MNSSSFRAHPWHGVSIGEECPSVVSCFIEIVPTDTVKYEVDKDSGFLKVDRPQLFSNYCPALYGFIPRTYCGDNIAEYASQKSGETVSKGDGDPLDILVLTEKNITHGDILVKAIPIGGLRMIDDGEADDKIIAVLKDDAVYGGLKDISELHKRVLDRIRHYFLTYKLRPDDSNSQVTIANIYGQSEAHEVIKLSMMDYEILCRDKRA